MLYTVLSHRIGAMDCKAVSIENAAMWAGQDALISKFPSDRNADHPCINSSTPIRKKCCSSTALYRTGRVKQAELTATGRTGCVTGDIVDQRKGHRRYVCALARKPAAIQALHSCRMCSGT